MTTFLCTECRLDHLETLSQTYSDNLTTIGIWVGIFVAIVGGITFVFGYLEPKKVLDELNVIKASLKDYEKKMELMNEIIIKQNELEGNNLRSLYDGADPQNYWKFIWSIRYSHWFYKNNNTEGLRIRIRQALKDFDNATNMANIKTFENAGGLKNQLRELESSGDIEISSIARQIIKKYYSYLE
jgi:hypothetical protein